MNRDINKAIVLLANLYEGELSKTEQDALHLAIAAIEENESIKKSMDDLSAEYKKLEARYQKCYEKCMKYEKEQEKKEPEVENVGQTHYARVTFAAKQGFIVCDVTLNKKIRTKEQLEQLEKEIASASGLENVMVSHIEYFEND